MKTTKGRKAAKLSSFAALANAATASADAEPVALPHGYTVGWHGTIMVLAIETNAAARAAAPDTSNGNATLLATSRGWRNLAAPDGARLSLNFVVTAKPAKPAK